MFSSAKIMYACNLSLAIPWSRTAAVPGSDAAARLRGLTTFLVKYLRRFFQLNNNELPFNYTFPYMSFVSLWHCSDVHPACTEASCFYSPWKLLIDGTSSDYPHGVRLGSYLMCACSAYTERSHRPQSKVCPFGLGVVCLSSQWY